MITLIIWNYFISHNENTKMPFEMFFQTIIEIGIETTLFFVILSFFDKKHH